MLKKYLLIFIGLVFFSRSTICQKISISGDQNICVGTCATYKVIDGKGGPYIWVTDGYSQNQTNADSITICWNTMGSNSISVFDLKAKKPIDRTASLVVHILDKPKPEIAFQLNSGCSERVDSSIIGSGEPTQDNRPNSNKLVCSEKIEKVYCVKKSPSSNLAWSIDNGKIIDQDNSSVTVQWPVSGIGHIKVVEESGLCKDSAILFFEVMPIINSHILVTDSIICKNNEIELHFLGNDVSEVSWTIDGVNHFGKNIQHKFKNAGDILVTATGQTPCQCAETKSMVIKVIDSQAPELECVGPICVNSEVTYKLKNNCLDYAWHISSHGTLTDGGGMKDDFVTVNWTNGPLGTIDVTTFNCTPNVCSSPTTYYIPIIDGTAKIQKPSSICLDNESFFSIQNYEGSNYNWKIAGNGTIISGQGTNEIKVVWDQSSNILNSTIEVSYDNCVLECGGYDKIQIQLKPRFNVNAQPVYCQNTNAYCYASVINGFSSAQIKWVIIRPDGSRDSTINTVDNFKPKLDLLGTYRIIGQDIKNDYCNDLDETFITVVENKYLNLQIEGPSSVCLNQPYSYFIPNLNGNEYVQWIYKNSPTTGYLSGNPVEINWKVVGTKALTAKVYGGACNSNDITLDLSKVQDVNIDGDTKVCKGLITNYKLTGYEDKNLSWTISPNDNGGFIKKNEDGSVTVQWLKNGTYTLSTSVCSIVKSITVNVADLIPDLYALPDTICLGEIASLGIWSSFMNFYELYDDKGFLITKNQPYNVIEGNYNLRISNSDGCHTEVPFSVKSYPVNTVYITSPDTLSFCLPHHDVKLIASTTTEATTYSWYRNSNIKLASMADSMLTNTFGTYHAELIDENGCTVKSNELDVTNACGAGTPGSLPVQVPFDISYITCDSLTFSVNSSFVSKDFNWYPNYFANKNEVYRRGKNFSYKYKRAGYYYVLAINDLGNEYNFDKITIPAVPDFSAKPTCLKEEMKFINQTSTMSLFANAVKFNWDFGDPTSSDNFSNSSDPTHIYQKAGRYLVTLTVEVNNFCISTVVKEVEVKPLPFVWINTPNAICDDNPIEFSFTSTSTLYNYRWKLKDNLTNFTEEVLLPLFYYKFSGNGYHEYSFNASNSDGCKISLNDSIYYTNITFNDKITSDKSLPVCVGEQVVLYGPPNYSEYLWSNGETTKDITVTDEDIYTLSVINQDGCIFETESLKVTHKGFANPRIQAFNPSNYKFYYDSITICQGEKIEIRAPWSSTTSYQWSDGTSNSITAFDSLAGVYYYQVTITDPVNMCTTIPKPFKIIVNPLVSVLIKNTNSKNCEGEQNTLIIESPNPMYKYFWNTGEDAISLTTIYPKKYYANVISEYGCTAQSNEIIISQKPKVANIFTGCKVTCFPDTLCIPSFENMSYQWLLNGAPYTNIIPSNGSLILNQAGDYNLILEDQNGCTDTSEVVRIDALPNNHKIKGIVYIDNNKNLIYDLGDVLYQGLGLNMFDGVKLVSNLISDVNGVFIFDTISTINPDIVVDTSGLSLFYEFPLTTMNIKFLLCNDEQDLLIPIFPKCTPTENTLSLQTCVGVPIVINNITLNAGDSLYLKLTNQQGCDSIQIIKVTQFDSSAISITPKNSCYNQNTGSLTIDTSNISNLKFSLNGTDFTTNIFFDSLQIGEHTLYAEDEHGCILHHKFEIQKLPKVVHNVLANDACINDTIGSISIAVLNNANITYSFDSIHFYPFMANPLSVPVNSSLIYLQDAEGCSYKEPYTIYFAAPPFISISHIETCIGGKSGQIIINDGNWNLNFSIDGGAFTDQKIFTRLGKGNHTINYVDLQGCEYQNSVIIMENPMPDYKITTKATCENVNDGEVILFPQLYGKYSISIDSNNWSFLLDTIRNLSSGKYNLFIVEDSICPFTFEFEIPSFPKPNVLIESKNLCSESDKGKLKLTLSDQKVSSYQFRDTTYTTSKEFANLDPGQYTINVKSIDGCEYDYYTNILMNEVPVLDFDIVPSCFNKNSGEIHIKQNVDTLYFSIDHSIPVKENKFLNLSKGQHLLATTYGDGCVLMFDFDVAQIDTMIVDFNNPVVDCETNEVELTTTLRSISLPTYSWSDGSTTSTIIAKVGSPLSVEVKDRCNLINHTWPLSPADSLLGDIFHIANVFAPDFKDVNGCFKPVILEGLEIKNYHFRIYDRWGNKMYVTLEKQDCWDGTFNSKKIDPAVFVWLVDFDYKFCGQWYHFKDFGDGTTVK